MTWVLVVPCHIILMRNNKMKKRYTALFTFVHFDKKDDIKDFINEELKYNAEVQLREYEDLYLLKYEIYSDTIDWHFADEFGNKVEMEDASTNKSIIPFAGEGHDDSEERFRVYFSRTIESDFQGEDYNLEDWMTTDDYFIGKENN